MLIDGLVKAALAAVLLAAAASVAPAQEGPPAGGEAPAQAAEAAPAEINDLDGLFSRLKHAKDAREAKSAEAAVLQHLLRSGSDTVDLLMQWSLQAINDQDYALALDLLDQVTVLKPDYAEGWNKRATVFYIQDEYGKSLSDIRRALALEPRHFGALSGLGLILNEVGQKDKAAAAFRQALDIHPFLEDAKKALGELEKSIGGQDI